MIKRFFWSSLSLPAYGQVGQGQHSLAAHFALRNTKFGGGKKLETESEGGQKFLPPNPLPFCPPERSVSVVPPTAGAINRSFVQKRFELRSVIATNSDILKIQRRLVARSPRLRRVSLRKKPCISELNQGADKFKFSFSGKQTAVRSNFFRQ